MKVDLSHRTDIPLWGAASFVHTDAAVLLFKAVWQVRARHACKFGAITQMGLGSRRGLGGNCGKNRLERDFRVFKNEKQR